MIKLICIELQINTNHKIYRIDACYLFKLILGFDLITTIEIMPRIWGTHIESNSALNFYHICKKHIQKKSGTWSFFKSSLARLPFLFLVLLFTFCSINIITSFLNFDSLDMDLPTDNHRMSINLKNQTNGKN